MSCPISPNKGPAGGHCRLHSGRSGGILSTGLKVITEIPIVITAVRSRIGLILGRGGVLRKQPNSSVEEVS